MNTKQIVRTVRWMLAAGLMLSGVAANASPQCKENGGFYTCTEPLDIQFDKSVGQYQYPGQPAPSPLYAKGKTASAAAADFASKATAVSLQAGLYSYNQGNTLASYSEYTYEAGSCEQKPAYASLFTGPDDGYPFDHHIGHNLSCKIPMEQVFIATGQHGGNPINQGGATARVRCPANTVLLGQPANYPNSGVEQPWFCGTPVYKDQTCPSKNPVSPGSGAKLSNSNDYQGAGAHPFSFERKYNSLALLTPANPFGAVSPWSHTYARSVRPYSIPNSTAGGAAFEMALVAANIDERALFRKQANGTWAADTVGNRNTLTELKDAAGVRTGWQHKRFEDDATETYSANGVLQSIKERNGWTTTLTYGDAATPVANYLKVSAGVPTPAAMPGLLISVKNHFGRELKFTYEAVSVSGAVQARMKELLPPGAVSGSGAGLAQSPIVYTYEEPASLGTNVAKKGQLTSVTWQDGTVKRYHYENTGLPNHLTGITDEAGVRIGTYAYNSEGKAISSEKAGGAEKLTFTYSSDGRTAVTDYSGTNGAATTRTYNIQVTGGVARPTAVTAPCPVCGSTQQSTVYGDGTTAGGGAGAKDQPIKTVAHDGTVTFYTYDAKGRETEKATFPSSFATSTTKPALASATTVASTQWHGTFNLPTKRAEPNKITAYTYNGTTGNLTGQSETQTTDVTGAAKFTAVQAASTPIKSTGWSYSSQQLPTTIVERETPFGSTTATETGRWTYTYDAASNLISAKDVTRNRTGTASTYDAQGRMLAGKSDVGVNLGYTYSPRGFVKQKTVSGQAINFTQNSIGLTTEVQTPDSQTITYVYDNKYKLIDVKLNGASVTFAMLAEGDLPDTFAKAKLAQVQQALEQVKNLLLPAAFAQAWAPGVINPGGGGYVPGPGEPHNDPGDGLNTQPPSFGGRDGPASQMRKLMEDVVKKCKCNPGGGFSKPTLTPLSWTHIYWSGHLGLSFSDKSYFSPAGTVNQSFVDEVIARDPSGTPSGSNRRKHRANLAPRIVGKVRNVDGTFTDSSVVEIIVQSDNCSEAVRAYNEIVTMYPDR